jgi:hypothetical protein
VDEVAERVADGRLRFPRSIRALNLDREGSGAEFGRPAF